MALLGSLAPLRSQLSVSLAPIEFAQQPLRVYRGGKAPRCSPGQHRPIPGHLLRRLSSPSRPATPCLPSLVAATTRTYRGRHAAAGSARSEAEPGLGHPPAPGSLRLPPPARGPRRDPAHCGPLRPPPRPGGLDLPPGQGDVASGEPPQPKENAEMQSARRRHLKEERVPRAARLWSGTLRNGHCSFLPSSRTSQLGRTCHHTLLKQLTVPESFPE
nr:sterile alpha motif domain-containing protein 1-like [Pongo abelii]